ncbi:alkaline phosphatase PafA [Hufsiella ginkgonis]|uniref:Alkaline phosphatase family protein n=1 Tax=Hufsiella ginkgonis TaxID=2695274 RepID=A0A7K1XVC9_9SPHI|nr:alkaline phosphatase PafA [Hufsiella ginkgonis]MXV14965.1 alkaline phosphatase family protein [Hufsiella ginkgonis]
MKRSFFLLVPAFLALAASAQKKPVVNNGLPRPRLVVGLVVDQMRWDYLYRYYERYGSTGFKRLLNEGFTCENTLIDYVPTVTAIGHSTIYTGSVPAIHGIAGNDFIIQATGKTMYCTEDSTVQSIGSASVEGKMSPKNLLASTITDELKLATNFRSKVIGVALKDRGGILPAGHAADAAYWYDDASGNWITSTYYMKQLPSWATAFNARKLPETYLKQDWNTLYPIDSYLQSSPDNNSYEGKFSNSQTPTFPVKTSGLIGQGFGTIRSTPYGNTFTLDFAKAIMENEKMGQDPVTDFLAVSLSSTDYVGHQFGPNSIEVEDTYLRLDRDLGDFFTYLDTKIGKGNYTVFLSADHGAAHNPTFLTDNNLPAGSWPSAQLLTQLNASLKAKYNTDKLVLSLLNYQAHLNYAAIAANKLDEAAIRADCVKFFQGKPGVAFAVDVKDVQSSSVPAYLRDMIVKGYNPERSGVIQIMLKPGWFSSARTGTSHGTWNPYDAHIPLLFMGWGINHGKTNKTTHMTDISATLAALLHIQMPNGCIGEPITEVIK